MKKTTKEKLNKSHNHWIALKRKLAWNDDWYILGLGIIIGFVLAKI